MPVRFGTASARWIIAAAVLGSGIAFLDGTVVNVALPAIADDLDSDVAGLQWVLNGYLVTLTALLLFAGALGDRYGRKRVFLGGLVAFTAASVLCALAPNVALLAAARALQGIGGAFLVPGSLAIIGSVFDSEDRGRAVGAWSGLTGIATAIGPFAGGWLIDAASWRFVFLINVPLAAIAFVITTRHVPESVVESCAPPDVAGAVLASAGLGALCWGLIERNVFAGLLGGVALVAFVVVEARGASPMLPLGLFRSRQFSGANATTLAVYAGLGVAFFLLVVQFQFAMGYSALEAGAALLPVTVLMLFLSSRFGALAQRIGPRLPMTSGAIVVAVGFAMFTRAGPGSSYVTTVLPAALVFGLGLASVVAPLTATVLASVPDAQMGVASGVNNAVARLAGLLAVATMPAAVGLDTGDAPGPLSDAVGTAMWASAALCAAGGVIAFLTVRRAQSVEPTVQPSVLQPCVEVTTS